MADPPSAACASSCMLLSAFGVAPLLSRTARSAASLGESTSDRHNSGQAYRKPFYDQTGPPQPSTSAPGHGQRRSYGDPSRVKTSNIEGDHTSLAIRSSVLGRRPTSSQDPDPTGLRVLYAPLKPHSVDIIFVHGLGGSSRKTWTQENDPDTFWPQEWLPDEPEITTARILTFGYNADIKSRGPSNLSNISHFARALLFGMKFGKDGDDLNVGKKPIIFVVHSIGGLILKKAYVQGKRDQNYRGIVEQIRAVLFLSTPHRETKLADFLNGLLSVDFLTGPSPKQFITDFARSSPSIEELNESFDESKSDLQLFSFYEMVETSLAGENVMLLEPNSSTLGFFGEITQPLDANHHDVCKYTSREDPNYQSVSSVLRELVKQYKDTGSQMSRTKSISSMKKVENLLGLDKSPQKDYTSLLHRCKEGTCRAVLSNFLFQRWENGPMPSSILWLYARPGSGKSVQASFLINHLLAKSLPCQYFFFQHRDTVKQTAGELLRSLAHQISLDLPDYETKLAGLSESNLKLEKMDARAIWEKLFVSALFTLRCKTPLYWIIDALDDAESAQTIVELFSSLVPSQTPIRILVTTRHSPLISTAMKRAEATILVSSICLDNNIHDIRYYVNSEKHYMPGSPRLRQWIVDQLVDRAEGSFLWVYLALREIAECHEEKHILQVLRDIPSEMEDLYRHMERTIADLKKPPDIALARMILAWTTYSRRSLHTAELLQALKPEHDDILDLRRTINQLCGHFVEVDSNEYVTLVHHTAREYLINKASIPFLLDRDDAHEEMFKKTLLMYIHRHLRTKMDQEPLPPLYAYAATSWAYHLSCARLESEDALNLMSKFFSGPFVLPWIQALAIMRQLRVLVTTSQALTAFIYQQRGFYQKRMALLDRVSDFDTLELWAVDLLKLIGKFGANLLEDPTSIYSDIPPFCPHNSQIYKLQRRAPGLLSVEGLSNNDEWDDLLARLSVGSQHEALTIACSGRFLAVLTSAGKIILWDSVTFEEYRTFSHQELVFLFCFSNEGDRLATYGFETTKIWSVSTGSLLHKLANPAQVKPLALSFTPRDTVLLVGLNTRMFSQHVVGDPSTEWEHIDSTIFSEDAGIPGAVLNSPTAIHFGPDGTQVAIAHRRYPLSVWALDPPKLIKRCKRITEGRSYGWSGVRRLAWHPRNGQVLGIYTDGSIFKWHPVDQTHDEIKVDSTPSEIQISFDGSVFLTGDVDGTIKLYNTSLFQMIYQLSSEDMVTAICFSPDGRRFYDIRGSCANIWEPNSLLRLYEGDNNPANETETWGGSVKSMSLIASEANAETYIPITALSARPQGDLLCVGNGDGLVEMQEISTCQKIKLDKSKSDMIIEHLGWAEDGGYYAYVELGSSLIVKSVDLKGKTPFPPKTRTIMKEKLHSQDGGAHRLLIDPSGKYVLVATSTSAQVWSIQNRTVCAAYKPRNPDEQVRWTAHPKQPDHVLAFTASTVTECLWKTLHPRFQWHLHPPAPNSPQDDSDDDKPGILRSDSTLFDHPSASELINQVILTQNKSFILLFLCQHTRHRSRRTRLLVLETASFASKGSTRDGPTEYLDTIPVPPDIASSIERPLEVIGQDRLVFLDESFRVCSCSIRHTAGPSAVVHHFFLPRDWVNAESLELCQVLGDGTFLCPRRGEVAVIRSDLGSYW